jgi:catalase (peroxidase I)
LTNVLYEEYLQSGGDWLKSNLLITLRQKHANKKVGRLRWLTYAEMLRKYDDTSIVKDLIERKTTSGDWKAHLLVPLCVVV